MKISVISLKLLCKKSDEFIEFGSKLSFFHGRMSSGKSTIVEMVNFCFGGKLIKTPAVSSEVLKAQLTVAFSDKEVLIERALSSTSVDVSWTAGADEIFRYCLPIQAGDEPVIGDDIFNLSDFLLSSMGIAPIKVKKRKSDEDSELHRLSFRDFFRFCYLDQPHLDSSLFRLEQPITGEKSKDVLKYIFGFQSDRLTVLQRELQERRQLQRSLRDAATQIKSFLKEYGFASEADIDAQVDQTNILTEDLEKERETQDVSKATTHFIADDFRLEAAKLASLFESKSVAVTDINTRLEEQGALRSELIMLKMKAARASTASTLLAGAVFKACPCCGTAVQKISDPDRCYLCKSDTAKLGSGDLPSAAVEQDLTDRIDDLDVSLRRLTNSLRNQQRSLEQIQEKRVEVQRSIDSSRSSVESQYLQRARQLESELGKLNERRRFLMKIRAMPSEIAARLESSDKLSADISKILREMEDEEQKFEKGRNNIRQLEKNFLQILRAIQFPEISEKDRVQINTKTWLPFIYPGDNPDAAWTFYDVGSGGKAVLFKICYALAIHKTVADLDLSMPEILIIDSTMKNITPDINPDVFKKFYSELYRLLGAELARWQCIIVDQTFSPFQGFSSGIFERKMVVDDPDFPPLISYYKGH